MASLTRTTMLRQSLLSTPSKRFILTRSPVQLLRPLYSPQSKQLPIQRSSPIQRIAAFHATIHRRIMPPGPQVLEGGINDAAPVPKPSPSHGSYHWTFERLLSIGLVPLTIVPFAAGSLNPALDAVLVATILLHSHIGFQSCVTDYFSTIKHPTLRKFFDWLLIASTIVVGVGFYEFETNDVGLTEALKRIWHAGANDATVEALSDLGHDGKLKNLK